MNVTTENFRVIVIDDSQPARENIEAQLRDDPEIEIVAQCANGRQAVEAVWQHRPDIIFLDVRMPGANGFDVLAGIPAATRPAVVFVTADDRFALQAFEVRAVDYLLKPFSPARFTEALARAKLAARPNALQVINRRLEHIMLELRVARDRAPEPAPARVREEQGRLFIRCGGEIHLVASEEIRWIQTDGDYVRLHTADKSHLVRMPLRKMMQKLDPGQFVRIHRSTAVNLRHLSRATPAPYGEYTVKLANGTKLKVSRTFVRSLKTHL